MEVAGRIHVETLMKRRKLMVGGKGLSLPPSEGLLVSTEPSTIKVLLRNTGSQPSLQQG